MGDNGSILATTNGGATWAPQASTSGTTLRSVAFSDATHGWAAGDDGTGGVILATTNGGSSWGAQSLGSASQDRVAQRYRLQ